MTRGRRPARSRFALGCTKAAVTRPRTIASFGAVLLVTAVLVGAVLLAGQIPFAIMRDETIGMVAVLGGTFWLARRPAMFGPTAPNRASRMTCVAALTVIAVEALLFINDLRLSPPTAPSPPAPVAGWPRRCRG
jgi:hypothetical protein